MIDDARINSASAIPRVALEYSSESIGPLVTEYHLLRVTCGVYQLLEARLWPVVRFSST